MLFALFLSCLASLSTLSEIRLPTWHPSDAPDADLRIRIERDEVRYDIAVNLGFVDEVLEFPREDDERLHQVEYEGLQHALSDFFKKSNHVKADGVLITPRISDFEVEQADMSLLPLFPRLGTRALIKARIVFHYSLKSEPQEIELGWGAYPPNELMQLDDMPAPPMIIKSVLSIMGEDRRLEFTADRPSYLWRRSKNSFTPKFAAVPTPPRSPKLALPFFGVVSLLLGSGWLLFSRQDRLLRLSPALGLCAIAWLTWPYARIEVKVPFAGQGQLPDAGAAKNIFEPLHANIYRAFDYSKESDIYDALARSTLGPYLEELYTQVYESLVMRDEGGAMSRVQSVKPLSFEFVGAERENGRPTFSARAKWRVKGAVFHWGHDHVRVHEYSARYRIVGTEQGWRISEHRVLSQERKPELESLEQQLPLIEREGEDR
ncbi:MAG: hypothetical protein CSA62_07605 [Planctomycetota bacterium]|nr:MAG: hypothetical protein CSA62_07605 [Planctomycetota bacterium]